MAPWGNGVHVFVSAHVLGRYTMCLRRIYYVLQEDILCQRGDTFCNMVFSVDILCLADLVIYNDVISTFTTVNAFHKQLESEI